jgi:hypothetical protein
MADERNAGRGPENSDKHVETNLQTIEGHEQEPSVDITVVSEEQRCGSKRFAFAFTFAFESPMGSRGHR